MYIQKTNDNLNINEILDKAENCRLGINGEINVSEAVKLLKSEELRDSDFALVTVKMIETFEEHFISESLFSAIRNMVLFLMRSKKFSMPKSAYNMTIEIDDSIDIVLIRNCIDAVVAVVTSVIGEISCKKSSSDKISEALDRLAGKTDIVFFENVTDSVFEDIDNIRRSFDKTSETCKILFAKQDIIKRLKDEYSSFYYQAIGHTNKNHPSAVFNGYTDIYLAFMRELSLKHKVTPGFSAAIKEYIDAVYPTADLQNEAFINDLIKRVEQQMLTAPFLAVDENGFTVTEEGVPFSQKVEENKNKAGKTTEIPIASFEDLTLSPELNVNAPENAPKNILLLSLSTFGNMTENKFNVENSDKKYDGIYQLDPIPKMLSDILSENNQYLDEIIMLETVPTVKPLSNPREIDFYGKRLKIECSPEQFFKCQVKNYLRPLPDGSDDNIDNDVRFKSIRIEDENHPSMEIKETVDYIREQYEKNNGNINLYIDAHGSLRGLSLSVLAINSLLLNENKGAKKVYSIKMDTRTIFEDSADSLFTFVSGLNEFRSFGRIDSLEAYMGEQAKDLTTPMKKLAEAISVCDIPSFERAIKDIKKFYSNTAASRQESNTDKENYLEIFANVIKDDYKNLLEDSSTVIDEIEWCFNKKLYQAALTIIESKVPGCIFGTETGNASLPLITFIDKDKVVKKWEKDTKYGKKARYLFETWLLNKYGYISGYNENGEPIISNKTLDGKYTAELSNHSDEVAFQMKKADDIAFNDKFKDANIKRFILLLKMLKATRNTINHCANNIPSVDIIHNALKDFLKMFRDIEKLSFYRLFVTDIDKRGRVYGHLENESQTVKLTNKSVQVYNYNNSEIKSGDIFKVRFKGHDRQIDMNTYEIV